MTFWVIVAIVAAFFVWLAGWMFGYRDGIVDAMPRPTSTGDEE